MFGDNLKIKLEMVMSLEISVLNNMNNPPVIENGGQGRLFGNFLAHIDTFYSTNTSALTWHHQISPL